MIRVVALLCAVGVASFSDAPRIAAATAAPQMPCARIMGAKLAPRTFAFPVDDAAHDGFATEWWRTFGRVTDTAGKKYDFSVNVSRFSFDGCGTTTGTSSRWAADAIVTTTWELLDESAFVVRRGSHTEREGALGARVSSRSFDLGTRIAHYYERDGNRNSRGAFSLSLSDREDGLDLEQAPDRALPLGPGGVMSTGTCVTCAAYAYAYPRSRTHGTLRIAGATHAVTGSTWIEHEYARHELASDDAGWNRYELLFDDGRELDARFTHDAGGRTVATSGVFVSAHGAVTYLHEGDARAGNVMHTVWRSTPTGVTYPSLWNLSVPFAGLNLATVEVMLDQEARDAARTPYYSGAIVVERVGPPEADHGHGYVELTGYGSPAAL